MKGLNSALIHTVRYVWSEKVGEECKFYQVLRSGSSQELEEFEKILQSRESCVSVAACYIGSYDPLVPDTQVLYSKVEENLKDKEVK